MTLRQPTFGHGGNARIDEEVSHHAIERYWIRSGTHKPLRRAGGLDPDITPIRLRYLK